MPFVGTLKTMPLPDLLQWLGGARKSGTLEIERNRVRKRIFFGEGCIIGCSSDDPPERLGQFLLSRGMISEDNLREALSLQELSGKHLGMILVEMEAMAAEDLSGHLEAKAEETIFSLFGWDEAVFRFSEEETDAAHVFPVSMRVEDVLLRGMKHFDDLQRIRAVLDDPGIVLRHTRKAPPDELLQNQMARTLYEAIDGERTIAEIVLHVHGSEYVVTKFLFELHDLGIVEIAEVRKLEPAPTEDSGPVLPVVPPSEAIDRQASSAAALPLPGGQADPAPAGSAAETSATATAAAPTVSPEPQVEYDDELEDLQELLELGTETSVPEPQAEPSSLSEDLEKIRGWIADARYPMALDQLEELSERYPTEEVLRKLTAEAEAGFIERTYRHLLPPNRIPVLRGPIEALKSQNLSPTEFFMLSRIDGSWDVKSIIQIAPMREIDALRTLTRMREARVIDLLEP